METLKYTKELSMVAHACNPSYLGGRKQEDHGSRPVQAKIHQTLAMTGYNGTGL
jgi:hypothetical protein